MQTLLEPTETNIEQAVTTPGTYYFIVLGRRLDKVRESVYEAGKDTMLPIHTTYDNVRRILRVTVSKP